MWQPEFDFLSFLRLFLGILLLYRQGLGLGVAPLKCCSGSGKGRGEINCKSANGDSFWAVEA